MNGRSVLFCTSSSGGCISSDGLRRQHENQRFACAGNGNDSLIPLKPETPCAVEHGIRPPAHEVLVSEFFCSRVVFRVVAVGGVIYYIFRCSGVGVATVPETTLSIYITLWVL